MRTVKRRGNPLPLLPPAKDGLLFIGIFCHCRTRSLTFRGGCPKLCPMPTKIMPKIMPANFCLKTLAWNEHMAKP